MSTIETEIVDDPKKFQLEEVAAQKLLEIMGRVGENETVCDLLSELNLDRNTTQEAIAQGLNSMTKDRRTSLIGLIADCHFATRPPPGLSSSDARVHIPTIGDQQNGNGKGHKVALKPSQPIWPT
ncbi:hypothetical protein KKF55_06520 [Patescibacteria group bacterium]|nr:hypothetical protein [Patescibacteria group bacterium]